MLIVGLTGGIGSGKSTVASMLRECGITVIDADTIAREVTLPYTKAWTKIKQTFGEEVIQADLSLDRAKLAAIIFNDSSKRQALNSIVHPEIYKRMLKQLLILFLKCEKIAVVDLPLLYESGYMLKFIAKVIVVYCSEEQQKQRIMARNNYSEEEANSRIKSQWPLEEKCKRANFVVKNCGSLEDTRKQVQSIVSQLISSKEYWKYRILFWSVLSVIPLAFSSLSVLLWKTLLK
ncbi:dephospho-CoA kinase-like protein [Dinothrombium tinctorium]|uniref:Dephospho-CoA kinase domain-containing protein n=1 Tax=Dinothrombium tinctorium TaxID=1965070 RepID=A0A3S3PEW3_9ACAR|nr:dephospho-CoA kinase-like protein [Dinothrombium tinctorium]